MNTTSTCRQAGLSLLEVLVVLALMAILLGLAAPGLAGMQQRQRLQADAQALWGSLVLARAQALERQQRIGLCPASEDGGACDALGDWSRGWLVFADDNRDGRRQSNEALLQRVGDLASGNRLFGNATVRLGLAYGADGRSESVSGGFLAGTLSLCRPGLAEGWGLVVNALGRPRLQPVNLSHCP